MSGDVSTGVREFNLEPAGKTGDYTYSWLMWPGIWTEAGTDHGHNRRLLLAWGLPPVEDEKPNKQLCCPVSLDKDGAAVPGDSVRSVRQLAQGKVWVFLWPLEGTDRLPAKYGPTVESYIARLEAGKGETE